MLQKKMLEARKIINSLRVMTTAYLFHKDNVLLMERSSQKSFIPGVWSGIGGHVESTEYNDLMSACLREIEEETGLLSDDVQELALRYVILRERESELRQQFIYFGTVTKTELATTNEGTLHWIPSKDIFNRKMSDSNRLMLEHYFQNQDTDVVIVGTMFGEEMTPNVHWGLMSDWE